MLTLDQNKSPPMHSRFTKRLLFLNLFTCFFFFVFLFYLFPIRTITFPKVQYSVVYEPIQNCDSKTATFHEASSRKTLYVVFYFDPRPIGQGGGLFESDWIINTMLAKIDRPIKIIDGEEFIKNPRNDTLHIIKEYVPEMNRGNPETYFKNLREKGWKNQGVYHTWDEQLKHDIRYYTQVDYVFFNYYRKDIPKNSNAHFVPLGTKTGYGQVSRNTLLPSSQRQHLTNFIGTLKDNREEMVDLVKASKISSYIFIEKKWASNEGLHFLTYRNTLRESAFTLAPWGNNPESLRLYEALEAGSIPIFQLLPKNSSYENPLEPMGANNPIPQFVTWQKALEFLKNVKKEEMDRLQERVINFWEAYKWRIQMKIKENIDRSFRESHDYDC